MLVFLAAASVAHAYDVTYRRPIGPGVEYTAIRRTEGPWEIRVFTINRAEAQIRMQMAPGKGMVKGVERLSGIIERETREDDYVIAAANGDFFVMAPDPWAGTLCGMAVRDGELLMTARNRPAFVLLEDWTPLIGVFDTQVKLKTPAGVIPRIGFNQKPSKDIAVACTASWGWDGDGGCWIAKMAGLPVKADGKWEGTVTEVVPPGKSRRPGPDEVLLAGDGYAAGVLEKLAVGQPVTIETVTTPALPGSVLLAVGGSGELVKGGKLVANEGPKPPRHPRTAIGYNDKQIILAMVDGRQPGWSIGMTLSELACLMQELGCTDALNLDGGGSTTAWVRGKVVNRPSDGRERLIANGVLVRSLAPRGPLARLIVNPPSIVALPGAKVPLELIGTDDWYNPVAAKEADFVVVAPAGGNGKPVPTATLKGSELTIGPGLGAGEIEIRHSKSPASAKVPLNVVAGCPKLLVWPSSADLAPGDSVTFEALGLTDNNERVWMPETALTWSVEGFGVVQTGPATFRATQAGGSAKVIARLGRATCELPIRVAGEMLVEDFEKGATLKFERYPDDPAISGGIQLNTGDAGQGKRFCRMSYDLGKPTATRAVYARLDRPVGAAAAVSLLARGRSTKPVWVRAALVDKEGTRHLVTLSEALPAGDAWTRLEARLPAEAKGPLTWQSVYVVATAGETSAGYIDMDDLRVKSIRE